MPVGNYFDSLVPKGVILPYFGSVVLDEFRQNFSPAFVPCTPVFGVNGAGNIWGGTSLYDASTNWTSLYQEYFGDDDATVEFKKHTEGLFLTSNTSYTIKSITYHSSGNTIIINVPDIFGKFLLGNNALDNSEFPDVSTNSTGGNRTHVLTVDEMPSHQHGAGTLTYQRRYEGEAAGGGAPTAMKNTLETASVDGSTGWAGRGDRFSIMPPYQSVNYIMRI